MRRAHALVLALVGVLGLLAVCALSSCAPRAAPPRITFHWVAGASEPRFDPDGPPHALRWALERWLSHGLADLDSSGRIVPAAAERWEVSEDGRTWTFHLREGLRYTDGSPCTSEDFVRALAAGLARDDHATRRWLLAAVWGADRVRAGKPLPPLGLEAPDPRTLRVKLARPDSTLPERLALPGVGTPWKRREAGLDWGLAVGLGPFRVSAHEPGRALTMVRAVAAAGGPDTLAVRFVTGAPRGRQLLRQGRADLMWPLPPGLLDESLPPGALRREAPARPARTLVLALRADTPPTHRLPARAALAHSLNRVAALRALGAVAAPVEEWPAGGGRFEFPTLDAAAAREWMAHGDLGISFHVTLGYDADEAGAATARVLQGEWARIGIYVELQPLRAAAARAQALTGGPQLELAEEQPLLERPEAELAALVMPLRGPAVGALRTGWRTREFDPWLWPARSATPGPFDAVGARRRLEEECVVLPLAELPWVWVTRIGAPAATTLQPRFGPVCIPPDHPLGRRDGR